MTNMPSIRNQHYGTVDYGAATVHVATLRMRHSRLTAYRVAGAYGFGKAFPAPSQASRSERARGALRCAEHLSARSLGSRRRSPDALAYYQRCWESTREGIVRDTVRGQHDEMKFYAGWVGAWVGHES